MSRNDPSTRKSGGDADARVSAMQRGAVIDAELRAQRWRWVIMGSVAVAAAIVALFVVFRVSGGGGGGSSSYPYQVGQPGPGAAAPAITLASTSGGTFDLGSLHGKTVLLFFQEGLGCQACWDQLTAIDNQMGDLMKMGISEVVSISNDPLDLLRQKVTDSGITSPALSDPDLAVSMTYHANDYGMMGTSRDGHTFIVVGPDGRIRWRADYGGAPNYTMDVPMTVLLQQMRAGLAAT